MDDFAASSASRSPLPGSLPEASRPASPKKSSAAVKKRKRTPKAATAATPEASTDSLTAVAQPRQSRQSSALSWAHASLQLIQRLLSTITTPLLIPLSIAGCFALLLLYIHYYVFSVLSSLSVATLLPSFSLLSSPAALYCSTIGLGCGSRQRKTDVGRLARSVAQQATQAHDIFQSLSALNDPTLVPGLHFVELWELAVAVSASSKLPSREILGEELKELGDLTRDVSDRLVGINSLGINSFSWTVREFKRIQQTIDRIHQKRGQYSEADISRLLDDLFTRLTRSLDSLIEAIQQTLPTADRASNLGGQVLMDLSLEHNRLLETKEQAPLWRALLDTNSFKGKQLRRDLDLASESIFNVKNARTQLEEMRVFLLRYRENVAYFKAGVIGFHLSDHQLEPEHEVEALADIVADFAKAVEEVKQIGMRKTAAAQPQKHADYGRVEDGAA